MTRWWSASNHRAGFSLLEALVALSLVAIILVIVLPSYSHYTSDQHALAVAHTLASDLRVAEQEAVTRRAAVTVTFPLADVTCAGGSVASYVLKQGATVIKRACFPADVSWSLSRAGATEFQPTGAPRAGLTVAVQSIRTGKRFSVTVAGGTGVVTDDTP
jgi:prepilin-type N-terminal cleavage/methylation domain-containing protein